MYFFGGETSYKLRFKTQKNKGFINKIKALLSLEFEISPTNGWNSEKGESMKILLRAYHQINVEEEKRIRDQMNK